MWVPNQSVAPGRGAAGPSLKAAEDCRTPKPSDAASSSVVACVLECGSPLPLFFAHGHGSPFLPHMLSTLLFSSPHWLWLVCAALVCGLLRLFWSYRAAPAGP